MYTRIHTQATRWAWTCRWRTRSPCIRPDQCRHLRPPWSRPLWMNTKLKVCQRVQFCDHFSPLETLLIMLIVQRQCLTTSRPPMRMQTIAQALEGPWGRLCWWLPQRLRPKTCRLPYPVCVFEFFLVTFAVLSCCVLPGSVGGNSSGDTRCHLPGVTEGCGGKGECGWCRRWYDWSFCCNANAAIMPGLFCIISFLPQIIDTMVRASTGTSKQDCLCFGYYGVFRAFRGRQLATEMFRPNLCSILSAENWRSSSSIRG